MENRASKIKKWKRLDTISFRGEKSVWLRFLSVIKKKGKKNSWEVLGVLLNTYLKEEGS